MAGMDMRAALLLLATLCLALGLLTSVNLPGVAESRSISRSSSGLTGTDH
jgi:hypothetical protein